jgi:excinuclease ABC subunit A
MNDKIIIKGAKTHNLKNINLEIPHQKLIVISGVSGSGKSSLAFDTIFAEGQRQYVESLSPYMRQFLGQKKAADVEEITGLAPAISIDQKALSHNPRSTVGTLTEIHDYLRVLFARLGVVYCPKCNRKIEKLSPEEMVDIVISQKEKKVEILSPVVRGRRGEYYQLLYDFLKLGYLKARVDNKWHNLRDNINLSAHKKHNIEILIDSLETKEESRLFEAIENALIHSQGLVIVKFDEKELLLSANWTCQYDNFAFPEIEARLFSFNSPFGACPQCSGLGTIGFFSEKKCPQCLGQRLKPEALSVKIKDKNIADLNSLAISDLYDFFLKYYSSLDKRSLEIAARVIEQVINRLEFLNKVGLNYLSLDRNAGSLSGGEAQRIRLSSQIGSQLSRTLYVLDEPTIGLHEQDTDKLIKTLKKLRDKNNTVIIVEHDERTIKAADYLIDLGPQAGILGGEVVVSGYLDKLLSSKKKSLTLDYLRGDREIALVKKRRTQNHGYLKIKGARANNLKNINLDIPLGKLIGLSGVSGSGKSSLLYDVLYKNLYSIKNLRNKIKLENLNSFKGLEYINKVVVIDQTPIGRSPRSNPATYTGFFTAIRDFYSSLPLAKERGYSISRFSFNRPGGRCEACQGAGAKLIEMHFLPPVLVECEVCKGKRFNRETLQVKYKKHNISDVLNLSIAEAIKLFSGNHYITDKLKVLQSVGLDYLALGQSATTLSGGEAQRVKIAKELNQKLTRRTLYLLDEPSTGLHYQDIEMLMAVLKKLVDQGNTVILIEHNLHILKTLDYIFDLGPEGGERGGKLIAQGNPEDIVANVKSVTGKYLKEYLK